MKYSIVTLVTVAAVVLTGCGEDRSHPKEGVEASGGSKTIKPYVYQTNKGKAMVAKNFVYIPGGFDVDGDGVDEGGFWLAKYEAREVAGSNVDLSNEGNVTTLIQNNFKAFDGNRFGEDINTSTYLHVTPADAGMQAVKVVFANSGAAKNNISAIEAILSLKHSQIANGYAISLPEEKQWMQLVKLAVSNPDNWTGAIGTSSLKDTLVFKNNLLGNDTNVEGNYSVTVAELPDGLSEWTKGAFKAQDRISGANIISYADINSSRIPAWWLPKRKDSNSTLTSVGGYYGGVGSNPIEDQNINQNNANNGAYAVTARGGDQLNNGIASAWVQYGFGYKYQDIGFRGASAYIKPSHYPYELQ